MSFTITSDRFWRKHIRYGVAGLFFVIALTAFLPLAATVSGSSVFGWDLIGYIQKLNVPQALPLIGGSVKTTGYALAKLFRFFLVMWALAFVLPLIEGFVSLLLRAEAFLLCSGLGVLVNVTIKIIVISQIRKMPELLQVPMLPNVLWTALHAAVAGLILWYLFRIRMENTKREVYNMQEGLLIDEPFEKGREAAVADRVFYGAIIGLSGVFKGKGYPMMMGETVFIGSTEGDHIKVRSDEEASLCQISYDEEMQEYHVHPTAVRCVHMKSGQPLGAHRLYCLPRGTELTIADSRDRFRLA